MTLDPSEIDRFAGNYIVEGRTPDGAAYNGTLRLWRKGVFLHSEAKLDPQGIRYGLAMPFRGRLVLTYGAKDKVEIGAYRIDGGSVHGMWVPPGATDDDFARCGQEASLRSASDPNLWTIQKAHAVDGSAYTGTLRLTPLGETAHRPTPARMNWSLHDGDYASFALAYDDAVYSTFNLDRGEPNGLIVYEIRGDNAAAGEPDLAGRWIAGGEAAMGIETLRRAETYLRL